MVLVHVFGGSNPSTPAMKIDSGHALGRFSCCGLRGFEREQKSLLPGTRSRKVALNGKFCVKSEANQANPSVYISSRISRSASFVWSATILAERLLLLPRRA